MSKELEDAYLDEVRSCDIFVLILWKTLRPAVLREYEEAVKSNRPILILVKLMREDERRERKLASFLGKIKKVNKGEITDTCSSRCTGTRRHHPAPPRHLPHRAAKITLREVDCGLPHLWPEKSSHLGSHAQARILFS